MERMYKKEKIFKIYLERILDMYSFFAYNLIIKIEWRIKYEQRKR